MEAKFVKKIMYEKSIMETCKNPFLVRLKATFQDRHYCYYLMEYCQAGDLLGVILNRPYQLTENTIKDIIV